MITIKELQAIPDETITIREFNTLNTLQDILELIDELEKARMPLHRKWDELKARIEG